MDNEKLYNRIMSGEATDAEYREWNISEILRAHDRRVEDIYQDHNDSLKKALVDEREQTVKMLRVVKATEAEINALLGRTSS